MVKNKVKVGRTLLLTGAGITFVVAIIIAVGVIPQVEIDPLATTASAVPAFWVNVLANMMSGLVLVGVSFVQTKVGNTGLLRSTGFGVGPLLILLGFFVFDAAQAFSRHGPDMQGTTAVLYGCTAGEAVAGLLVLLGASLSISHQEA